MPARSRVRQDRHVDSPPGSAPRHSSARRWWLRLAGLAGALLVTGLLWALGATYQTRKVQHQHQAERELQTIGRLQTQALEGWREARFSDADALTDDALLAQAVVRWRMADARTSPSPSPSTSTSTAPPTQAAPQALGTGDIDLARKQVQDRLRILQERSRYSAVAFVDLEGRVLLSGESMGSLLPAAEQQALARAVEVATPQAVEPRRDPFFAFPFFSLVAPIFDGTQTLGAVWLVMDVRTSLYPLLSPWPTSSQTGESVLVMAEGPSALLLSPRRDQNAPGAGTLVPASLTQRPVVQAAAGARGVIYGEDEQDNAVLAVVNAVADSPWYLVSQVQVSEAFGGAAQRELLVLSLPVGFAALLAGVLLGAWQWRARQRESALKNRLAENMQWLESAQQAASIGYFVYDASQQHFRLSTMAGELLDLPADQPLSLDRWLAQVHHADRAAALAAITSAVQHGQPMRLKMRLHSTSRLRWVDLWGRHDPQDSAPRMTGTVQDITEREQAEAKLAEYRQALEAMVRQDALTGVGNRRALTEAVEREWQRAARAKEPISLLMIDVDYFKPYNDHYGHLAGDDCLRQVARALSTAANRSSDMVARYGGEEFAVLLPGTPAADAEAMAERARAAVQNLCIAHKNSSVAQVVTVSIGVTTLTPPMGGGLPVDTAGQPAGRPASVERQAQRMFDAADRALYAAKDGGRNRVEVDAKAAQVDEKHSSHQPANPHVESVVQLVPPTSEPL